MSQRLSAEEDTCARRLWREAGLDAAVQSTSLAPGANNRVFRLTNGDQQALLKVYYTGADDPRDRFGAEVAFARFLQNHDIPAAPKVLATDREANMALFEFIEGRRLNPGEVTKAHVASALEFVLRVNQHRSSPEAAGLPEASEACFSIPEHLGCVERRVQRLADIGDATAIDREARQFVERDLTPAWVHVRQRVRHQESTPDKSSGALRPDQRCLSPSDFGFHNALVTAEGRLRFFDFEYAGWDDPAKLACDFFCQVEVPAPMSEFRDFAAGLTTSFGAHALRRTELLLPVYRIKWCCIVLNEFLPAGADHRRFARGGESKERKAGQLAKSRAMLQQLKLV
jgi:hypothetical protein